MPDPDPGRPRRCRTMLVAMLLAAFPLSRANATLQPGAVAPDFTARATLGGNEFQASLAVMLRKGPVVVYFYPAAFTKGCTVEAHDFAEAIPDFAKLGASVIGVSEDRIETLDNFSTSACQSRFPVAADPSGAIARSYDASMPLGIHYASRTSYAIAPDGRILAVYSAMDPDAHVSKMLTALGTWKNRSAPTR